MTPGEENLSKEIYSAEYALTQERFVVSKISFGVKTVPFRTLMASKPIALVLFQIPFLILPLYLLTFATSHSGVPTMLLTKFLLCWKSCFLNSGLDDIVFKLSTVGDCYIAATDVPFPREDHALILAQFAVRCLRKACEVLEQVSEEHGLDGVSEMNVRIGIHSGSVTAGVLRGDKARFNLFGDTINTASRIESTGEPGRIHLSKETAELIERAGKVDWLTPRKKSVLAKGNGILDTFWLKVEEADEGFLESNSCSILTEIDDVELTNRRPSCENDDNDVRSVTRRLSRIV
ncbi:hypothetical protein ACHAWF_006199 [Thalassiosira exigua]